MNAPLGSWNLVRTLTWMTPTLTLRDKVIGQGHQVKKRCFRSHLTILLAMVEVKVTWVKVTRSKMWFQVLFYRLTGSVQGQGLWVRVKVKLVKPSLKLMILAGGLTSMSSCFIRKTATMLLNSYVDHVGFVECVDLEISKYGTIMHTNISFIGVGIWKRACKVCSKTCLNTFYVVSYSWILSIS